jgi:N-acyl-D-amino-acid deacylase
MDLVIRNGTIVDGTGAARYTADVGVADGHIAAIGPNLEANGAEQVDASGLVVSPGFIDVHTHDDRLLLSDPAVTPKVSQGVTTLITGNCGVSIAPLHMDGALPPPLDLLGTPEDYRYPKFADYLETLDAAPPAVNAACLVGHSTLRVGAMDDLKRGATGDEIKVMQERLDEALEAGAVGMSTGLFYDPAHEAPTEEIIALAEHLAPAKALYTSHIRDEAAGLLDSVAEGLRIGREAGVKVVFSHHKALGTQNFGLTRYSLEMIEENRASQPIALDVYPYIAASTVLKSNSVALSSRTMITWSRARPEFAGRDLADVAEELGLGIEEAIAALQPAGAIYYSMDEEDVQRVLRYHRSMIGSDGLPHDEKPHPRLWGTFPRVLGHYSRDLGLFSLEEAVHRMTGLPAEEFNFQGRGVLAEGNHADLVLFDADTVIDRATFDDPMQPAGGIDRVYVNGTAVWQDGAVTGARPGKVLRRLN